MQYRKITIILIVFIFSLVIFGTSAGESYATISQRGTATTTTHTSGTTLTLAKPTGATTGDILIATVCVDTGSSTFAATSGANHTDEWSTGGTRFGTAMTCYSFYKYVMGDEPANFSWTSGSTFSGTNSGVGVMAAFKTDSVYAAVVMDQRPPVSTNISVPSTTHTLTGDTTSVANAMLVAFFASDDCSAACYSGYTNQLSEIADVGSSSIAVAAAAGIQAAAGATGNIQATVTSSDGGGYFYTLKEDYLPVASTPTTLLVKGTRARVSGYVNPKTVATDSFVVYGTTFSNQCSAFAYSTTPVSAGSDTSDVSTGTVELTGLSNLTTYYYCIAADDTTTGQSERTVYSSVSSFTTGTSCDADAGGNFTTPTNTNCAFPMAADGVDAGTGTSNTGVLTISSGRTLTLTPAQNLSYGAIVKPGANITKFNGAVLRKAPIWVSDPDGDGYMKANPSTSSATTQPANTSRRNAVQNWYGAPDCLDSGSGSQYVYGNTTVPTSLDADQDGYAAGSVFSGNCVGDSTTVEDRTYYVSRSGNADYAYVSNSKGSNDCNDSDAVKSILGNYYVDNDGDEYSPNAGTSSVCGGTDSSPVGYSRVNKSREIKTFVASSSGNIYTDSRLGNYVYRIINGAATRATYDGSGGLTAFTSNNQTQPPVNMQYNLGVIDTSTNDYIFAVAQSGCSGGGYTAGCTVYSAPITNGNIGAWTSTGQAIVSSLTSRAPRFIFQIGSSYYVYKMQHDGTSYHYYRSLINTTNGTLGSWTEVSATVGGSTPVSDMAFTTGLVNGKRYIYHSSGKITGNIGTSATSKAELDLVTGDVGTFASLAVGLPYSDAAQYQNQPSIAFVTESSENYLFYFSSTSGGCTQANCSKIYKAKLNINGSVNPAGWVLQANVMPSTGLTPMVYDGFYVFMNSSHKTSVSATTSAGLDTNDSGAGVHP